MNKQAFVFFDTETTGLDPTQGAEILQLAAKAIDPITLEDHAGGEFEVLIKPQHPELASPKALEVIGPELFERAKTEGLEPKVAIQKYMDWLNSLNTTPGKKFFGAPILAGHNVQFDMRMLEHYLFNTLKLYKNRDDVPYTGRQLDTWAIMFMFYESDPDIKSYTLDNMLGILNLSRASSTHDAMEDVRLGTQVFVRFMKMCRDVRKRLKVRK